MAGVDEIPVVVVVSQQNRAEVLARVAGLGEAPDDELLALLDLQLEPCPGAFARFVDRVFALRDHTLPPGRLGFRKHARTVRFRFADSQCRVAERSHKRFQSRTARWQSAKSVIVPSRI